MDTVLDQIVTFLTTSGLKVIGAILILIAGRVIAGVVRRIVRRAMTKADAAPSLVTFAGTLSHTLVIVFAVVAALAKFGIETASFVAILGAASFAIGFALQGSLSNFAAGVMLLVFRPFKLGDFVDAGGVAGSVREIRLFTTVLVTPDNVKIMVPNGKVFGDTITNYSAYDTRRLDVTIGIGYGESIERAREVLSGLIQADARVHADPEPQILVTELADSSVNLTARVWVASGNFWPVKLDLNRGIKEAFDQHGIEIPFPQRVVHVVSASAQT
jgi:small conductance mechanosensitive channel